MKIRALLASLVFLLTVAQSLAELPPEAQESMKKGLLAAKQQKWVIAIQSFQDVRKTAPEAPEVFYNLGLAESKIPGRELRAICWLGAYLAANPTAPNAAAVKEQISVLDIRSQSNTSRLIKTLQESANHTPRSQYEWEWIGLVARLWAEASDIPAALRTADLYLTYDAPGSKSRAQVYIARAQAERGDIAGAQKTFAIALKTTDLVQKTSERGAWQEGIVEAQVESGDISGAQKTADLIQDPFFNSYGKKQIAEAQIKAGDIAGAQKTLIGAQKTANLIQNADQKSDALKSITEAKAKIGDTSASNSTTPSTSVAKTSIHPFITVSDWLERLDDDNKEHDCPLNTEPFLDLAGYLKSPPSDTVGKLFDGTAALFYGMNTAAEKIVTAQNVINGMLKQQAKK